MKLGVSTWLWTSPFRTETTALFPKIKRMGFDFVEIPVEDPSLIDGKAVRRALDNQGLTCVVCGAFGPTRDLTHEDPQVHAVAFDYIARCLELCGDFGTDVFAGPMYSAVGKRRVLPAAARQIEWERAVTNVRQVATLAAAHRVRLAIEPLNRFETDLVNNAEHVVRLVDEIAHPAAGIMMDSYHMALEERNNEQALRAVGHRLVHVQVSDNYRGCPGKGQVRWDTFKRGLEACQAAGYRGGVAIESFTPEIVELANAVCFWRPMEPNQDEFATDGLAFLKRLFA
jgi:D-psicose/D-tagatose/L-ribulose 3-epimerase